MVLVHSWSDFIRLMSIALYAPHVHSTLCYTLWSIALYTTIHSPQNFTLNYRVHRTLQYATQTIALYSILPILLKLINNRLMNNRLMNKSLMTNRLIPIGLMTNILISNRVMTYTIMTNNQI